MLLGLPDTRQDRRAPEIEHMMELGSCSGRLLLISTVPRTTGTPPTGSSPCTRPPRSAEGSFTCRRPWCSTPTGKVSGPRAGLLCMVDGQSEPPPDPPGVDARGFVGCRRGGRRGGTGCLRRVLLGGGGGWSVGCRAVVVRVVKAGFPPRPDTPRGVPGTRTRRPGQAATRSLREPGHRARNPDTAELSDRGGNPAQTRGGRGPAGRARVDDGKERAGQGPYPGCVTP